MNVLIISPFKIYPVRNGFQTRVYNLTKQIARKNNVTLLYVNLDKTHDPNDCNEYLPNVQKFEVRTSSRIMQLFHPILLIRGYRIIKEKEIDLIIAESNWAGVHALILHVLSGTPYILNEQNAEYIRWKRMGKRMNGIVKFLEKYCCKYAKKVLCVSDIDKELISNLGIAREKIRVIPNGVDTSQFSPNTEQRIQVRNKHNISVDAPVLLFSGSLSYLPNRQAVEIIYTSLINTIQNEIPDIKLLIVGANPPHEYIHEAIVYTGAVDKIESYINASDVVIAPLVSGGGTKLKIIEALACGKYVVTTKVGAEGLEDEKLKHYLRVVDDWDQFSLEVIRILKQSNKTIARIDFMSHYSWDRIGECLLLEISDEFILQEN